MRDTLLTRLERHAHARPDAVALVFASRTGQAREVTWAELQRLVSIGARRWRGLGLTSEDRVVIVTESVQEQVFGFLGALAAGGQPSIFSHPSMKQSASRFGSTFAAVLRTCGARWVFAGDTLVEGLRKLELGSGLDIVSESEHLAASSMSEVTPPTDARFVQFSSGTTGARKGVVIGSEMLARQALGYGKAIGLSSDDVIVSWLPLYHDMGLVAALLLPLFEGARSVQVSPFDWIQRPSLLFKLVDRYSGTLAWLPNFAFQLLAQRIRDEDLRGLKLDSVRMLINCSEPVRDDTLRAFEQRFAAYGLDATKLNVCYAMAENTFAVTQTPPSVPARRFFLDRRALRTEARVVLRSVPDAETSTFVSCGLPIEGTSVRIASDAADQIGEIEVKGDCLFGAYLDADPSSGASVDGWYSTGDLGCIVDGELLVTGRKKDLIISRGVNVYPEDIEAIIGAVDGVKPGRVVVFGVSDSAAGTELIVAMLETEPGAPEDLTRRVGEAVFEHAGVTLHACVVSERGTLVKSTSGKLSRSANRALYLGERT